MRKIILLLIVASLLMPNISARADISPPSPAPGSGIIPSQETNVRMVAENVLMVVKEASPETYSMEVTAEFLMRNLGDVDEHMQVRFPMESIFGLGDGWGGPADIKSFRASINGVQISTKELEEPYQSNDLPINWAAFDVDFPVGGDVYIRLSYVTDMQNEITSDIEYILGTGAGWFDSIGNATITIRFPYSISMTNIVSLATPENAVTIGKEIRWHWQNYEPEAYETVTASVVNPAEWTQILSLESKIGVNSSDVDTAITLSQAYQRVGSEKHGCMISTNLADLAEIAIEQVLPLRPQDIRLHVRLAEVYLWRLDCWRLQSANDPIAQKLQDELKTIFELDPTNERATEIQRSLQSSLNALVTSTPSAAPTNIVVTKTVTNSIAESQSYPTLSPTPLPEPIKKSNDFALEVLWGTALTIIGIVIGATYMKRKQKTT